MCVNAIGLHAKEDVLKHLLKNINYTKIVAIVYIKYVLVAVTNSIITVIVCVLIVGHKWMTHLEVADSEVLEEVVLEEVDLADLVGSGEKVSVNSETLIGLADLAFHSVFYHLTLMTRVSKRVILISMNCKENGKI